MRRKISTIKKTETNAKVRNAQKITYKDIKFQSKLEMYCYKYGKEELGYPLEYESFKTVLFEGPRLDGYLYQPNKSKHIALDTTKLRDITYSPDFTFVHKTRGGLEYFIVVECKGLATDSYNLKKKLFLALMNKKYGQNFYFFEPHSQIQIRECFEIIKQI